MNPSTTTKTITKSIRYTVPSKSGGADHIVSVDPRDGRTSCDCRAGSFGKDCHAQKAVRAGEAGKPIVRCTVRPDYRVQLSDAARRRQSFAQV
jgi:hypothetical protein